MILLIIYLVLRISFRKYLVGELLVIFLITFLLQIFSQLQDLIKFVLLQVATVSINGLTPVIMVSRNTNKKVWW